MLQISCYLLTTYLIAVSTSPDTSIHCGSTTSSQITSTINHDYYFDLTANSISSEYNNSRSLDIDLITSPPIPIEIYFLNSTIYKSCLRECHITQVPLSQIYILRLNKYIPTNTVINYTLTISCHLPIITTQTYTTATSATTSTAPSTSEEFDYSVSFNQQLTFANRGNILSFGVSTLLVLFFITMGLFVHHQSDRPELGFVSRKSNASFYLCANATLLFSIIMCSTEYLSVDQLGILIAFTMTSINFIAVIGMKYYGSLIQNVQFTKKSTWSLARLCRFGALFMGVFYLIIYYVALQNELSLLNVVWVITLTELVILSIASFASKTAQVQWMILFLLIAWLTDSTDEEIFFNFYWYCIFCIGCALASIFLFANKKYVAELRQMFINVFGAFLSLFDISTDITVMVIWLRNELYFWTIMQLIFIFSGTIYSAFYIDDYYFIGKGQLSPRNNTENKGKAKRLFWGRIFTLFGLGRVYHGVIGWDQERNKDMEISNRVLKVWEMIFESFPTICLQLWISLYTELDVNIVMSLFVGVASISFTFFRVLYFDHISRNTQDHLIVERLQRRQSSYHSSFTAQIVPPPADDDEKEEEQEVVRVYEEEDEEKKQHKAQFKARVSRSRSETVLNASLKVAKSRDCTSLWRNFICCYPVKAFVDHYDDAKQKKKEANQKRGIQASIKEKLFYFMVYLWVMTDFGIRVFPILACARLREQYLEFLAVLFGLTIFEFFAHFFMLRPEFQTPRHATKFFWTLYFTVSYCFLSSMHIIYLMTNVYFDRLIIEHCVRMMIQALFMILAMVIQHYEYGGILGFFDRSIVLFWCTWTLNWMLTYGVRKGYKKFERKFKQSYAAENGTQNHEDEMDEEDNDEDGDQQNQLEMSQLTINTKFSSRSLASSPSFRFSD